MMNMLIKIFELNHKLFWKNFKGIKDIRQKVTQLFELITPEFAGRIVKVEVNPKNFSEFDSTGRKDFSGDFDLIFNLPNGREVTMNIKHLTSHAEMNFVNSENKQFDCQYLNTFYNSLPSTLPLIFLKNYIEPTLSIKQKDVDSDILQNIFFSGNINNNKYKKALLMKIFKYLIEDEYVIEGKSKDETAEILQKIIINILSSVALKDPAIKTMFSLFCVYQENLTEEEVAKFWINSYKNEKLSIYKLWNKRILKSNYEEVKITLPEINKKRVKIIFDILEHCSGLRYLQIKDIPEKLKEIVLSEIGRLEKLKNLDISENKLGEKSIVAFCGSLENLVNLEKLNLSGTFACSLFSGELENTTKKIKNKSNCKEKLLNTISKCKRLVALNLSNNDLCIEGDLDISNTLRNLSELRVLELSKNSISQSKDVEAICNAFGELPYLTIIDLSSNGIKSCDTKFVSEMLPKLSNLTVFRYSGNNSGIEGGIELAKGLAPLKNLVEIDLSKNSLMESGALAVIDALQNSPKLQRLFLPSNFIRASGAKKISISLGKLVSLEELDLGSNNIKDEGLLGILKHLQSLKNLRSLDLSVNSLEDEGIIALSKLLPEFLKLNLLGLSRNQIGTEGASILLKSLKDLKGIEVIDIADNDIDSTILSCVLDVLQNNKSLTAIYLSKNNIEREQEVLILNNILELTNKVDHDIEIDDYDDQSDSDIEFSFN